VRARARARFNRHDKLFIQFHSDLCIIRATPSTESFDTIRGNACFQFSVRFAPVIKFLNMLNNKRRTEPPLDVSRAEEREHNTKQTYDGHSSAGMKKSRDRDQRRRAKARRRSPAKRRLDFKGASARELFSLPPR